ncbi:DUF3352 domain-containing protein [Mangrovibacterium sp.]|uniref:DUF3352 domain-containing protein n=1 Tax=Mangrovibacterium sp. TaxID=1961364 RepID=UPI00356A2C10
MRKFILPLLLILIVVFGAVWYFTIRETTSYSENSAFQAIPLKTPLVVEIPELGSLVEDLQSNNELVVELRSVDWLKSFWNDATQLESLMAANEDLREAIQSKSVLIAFNPEGKNDIGALFAFSLENRAERQAMIGFFEGQQQESGGKLTQRMYDGQEVYQYRINGQEYFFSESKGIFLFSRNAIFVEEAIRQISSENLLSQEQFQKLYSTVSSSSDFNVFINHKKLSILLDKLLTPDFRTVARQFANFADWSELDVILKKNELLLNGFSFSGNTADNYLSVLRKQEGQRFSIDEALSANTSLFVNLNLQNFKDFQDDYEEFLKKQGSSFYNRDTRLTIVERQGKKKLIPLFEEISDDDFALAFGSVLQNEPTQNRFFIAKVKSRTLAQEAMLPVLENFAKGAKKTLQDTQTEYKLQEDRVFNIYEFPIPDLAELLFGEVFSAVSCNYCCFYDNYLIFSDNETALKSYIHDLVLSETLERDVPFQKFNQQMASRSSCYFYLNVSRIFNLHSYYLNEETVSAIKNNEQVLRKFYGLGWQISSNSGELLNNLYLRFDPILKEEPQTVWQSKLDTTISGKPQLVTNHNDRQNKEVIVQDNNNNLYLINKEGVRLWKIKLSGKILGDVHQVDYYRNGKLQYLFNTQSQLYLLDRNGNHVAKFPVSFRAPATNGVAVFDYDGNRNYRFFVACENKQIYAYDRDGKSVQGWKAENTDGQVTEPLKHFRIEGKDYLVCADRYRTYILDRQGDVRVKTESFEHSGNDLYLAKGGQYALATTDAKGKVILQYFDGKTETRDLGSFGAGHFFVAEDLNNDGKTDFILTDGKQLAAYSDRGKELFDRDFSSPISNRPNIYTFTNNDKKIGLVCRDENRVYLVNVDGKLYDGFSLQGNTDFSIGSLASGNSYFNLLVGNEDNSFFNYKVD